MKNLTITFVLILSVAITPVPALAQTDTGPTPGSFWYGVTTTFENINLFFTFNSEKKAEKALRYAEKRLAQAASAAEGGNGGATETALADYEAKFALASESSKNVKDAERAEKLFTTIADNSIKHQETLAVILEKVPEEVREAIKKAIEVSKRGQEEAARQIAELKGEIESLRQELAELKAKDEERQKTVEEINKQKAPTPQTNTTPTHKSESAQIPPKTEQAKSTSVVTLPNGAVVEMDANGNIIRTIKEAPRVTDAQTTSSIPPTQEQVSSLRKELKVFLRDGVCRRNDIHGTVCDIDVFYLENGEQGDEEITISSNDPDGFFIGCRNQKQGKTITCPTRRDVYDGKPIGVFNFIPLSNQSGILNRTVIVSAGGISTSKVIEFEYFKKPEAASLEVKNLGGMRMYGGYCGTASLNWVVKDQYGNDFKVTEIKVNGQTVTQSPYHYRSPNFNTVEELKFSYGDLSTMLKISVFGSMREERGEDAFFKDSAEVWRDKSSGMTYYPLTDTCK